MKIGAYLEAIKGGGGEKAGVSYLIAADALGVSKPTIAQMVVRGELDAVRIEGKTRTWRHITAKSLLTALHRPPPDTSKIQRRLEKMLWDAAYEAETRKLPKKVEYGVLMEAVGLRWNHPQHRGLIGEILGDISEKSNREYPGLLLSTLAVRKATRRPNEAFFELAAHLKLLRAKDDRTRFYRGQLQLIVDHVRANPRREK